MEPKISQEELKYRQSLSLRDKIDMSAEKIEQWYDHWNGLIYIAFSGGKDSTVLRHLVHSIFPEVPSVFSDTGLEFPEIKEFVKSDPSVVILRPKLSFRQVIEKYGYAVVSKEQSQYLYEYRTTHSQKLRDIHLYGNKKGNGKISKKWRFLIDSPFLISDKCCDILKKNPAQLYEKKTERKPIIGTLATDGRLRTTSYLTFGCNIYNSKHPTSRPLSFWTEKDIWDYIHTYDISYSKIYDMGYERTGCMFCLFGIHLEKEPNRMQKIKQTHPKLYQYCIDDLGIGKVLDFIHVPYE